MTGSISYAGSARGGLPIALVDVSVAAVPCVTIKCIYIYCREDHFDPAKRARTLEGRGLDFADAEHVFAGPTYTIRDERLAYPEPEGRFITAGFLATRMVIIAWTPIEGGRHIISMRKANDREQARYRDRFEQT